MFDEKRDRDCSQALSLGPFQLFESLKTVFYYAPYDAAIYLPLPIPVAYVGYVQGEFLKNEINIKYIVYQYLYMHTTLLFYLLTVQMI